MLSLNTWGLPIAFSGHDQTERFSKIPEMINSENADIICLQECFSSKLRKVISEELLSTYCHKYSNENRRVYGIIKMDNQGGLITLSRYPIIQEWFFPFTLNRDYNMIERLGKKGVLISHVDIDGHPILVVNTHLYSGNNVKAEKMRMKQIRFIHDKLREIQKLHPYNVVMAGDLNITHPLVLNINPKVSKSITYDYIINGIGFEDPIKELRQDLFTIDPKKINTQVRRMVANKFLTIA